MGRKLIPTSWLGAIRKELAIAFAFILIMVSAIIFKFNWPFAVMLAVFASAIFWGDDNESK